MYQYTKDSTRRPRHPHHPQPRPGSQQILFGDKHRGRRRNNRALRQSRNHDKNLLQPPNQMDNPSQQTRKKVRQRNRMGTELPPQPSLADFQKRRKRNPNQPNQRQGIARTHTDKRPKRNTRTTKRKTHKRNGGKTMTIFGRPKKNVMTEAPQYQPPTPTMAAQVTQHPTPSPHDVSPELNDAIQELQQKYSGVFNAGDLAPINDILLGIFSELHQIRKNIEKEQK